MGRKFTVFALFYFVFKGKFQVQPPSAGAYIGRGDLTEGFLHNLRFGRAYIFGGAYTRRGLFSEFYGCQNVIAWCLKVILEKKI